MPPDAAPPLRDRPAPFGAEAWSALLTSELKHPVQVSFGRARRNVLVARPTANGWSVRMNAFFAEAPPEIRTAVVRWLSVGRRARRACGQLDAWIEESVRCLPPGKGRREPLVLRGEHHDLVELSLALQETFARPDYPRADVRLPPHHWPPIGWGRRNRGRARRSLQLGSYDPAQRLIRIHPVLDQPAVPAFFVRAVLFHELLHAALPSDSCGGRAVHHGPLFRQIEREYVDHGAAQAWQERHITALIRSARTGKPMRVRGRRKDAPAVSVTTLLLPFLSRRG